MYLAVSQVRREVIFNLGSGLLCVNIYFSICVSELILSSVPTIAELLKI